MPRKKQVKSKNVKRKTATQKRNSKARIPVVVSEATKNLCRNWLKTTVGQAERPEIESAGESDRDDDYVTEEIEQVSLRTLAKVPKKQLTHSYLFECEWDGCKFECDAEAPYFKHVNGHSKFGAFSSTMSCLWDLCKFETPDVGDMERHINFHAYHTKLKTYGLGLREFVTLPACRMDSRKRNDIPEQPTSYPCSWDECPLSFQESIQDFLDHVFSHAASSFAFLDKKIKDVKCLWLGCEAEIKRAKLRAHIDAAHVREKVIGCHNCGTLFVRRKGLVLHCQRQVDDESCQYQCPECMKLCATPQLFREHAKQHMVNYKCDICQMTFVSRSALSLHIRTRHIATDPFQCPHCDKGCKVKRQFEAHLRTHTNLRFHCPEFQCSYSSKTKEMLTRHRERKHEHYVRIYKCHMCNRGYRISKSLTKHLRTFHDLEYPSGHKRFTYRQYEDGFYRLVESKLDNYALREDEPEAAPMILPDEEVPETGEMSVKFSYRLKQPEELPLEPAKKMVTITVHDEDAEGNVIREKTLQVDEIFEAPEQ